MVCARAGIVATPNPTDGESLAPQGHNSLATSPKGESTILISRVIRSVMIDTMVFDALYEDPEGRDAVLEAVRLGELRLLTTHVQEDQIAAIRDPQRRKALQRVPRTVVPSAVVVEGVTRTGRARVNARSTYARMRDVRHFQDSLIVDATAAGAHLLVTDDRRLAREAYDLGTDVWSSAELLEWAKGRRARR